MLDSNKGSAIALGILYISIAQEINIPIFGVDLHLHFIASYMDDTQTIKNVEEYSEEVNSVLYRSCKQRVGFTHNEINRYLEQLKLESKPEYFVPCNNTQIIQRLINDMISAYRKEKMDDKAEFLIQLLNILIKLSRNLKYFSLSF